MYRDTKGLVRKNYICDLDNSIGGGIYCFESRQDADSWFDDAKLNGLQTDIQNLILSTLKTR